MTDVHLCNGYTPSSVSRGIRAGTVKLIQCARLPFPVRYNVDYGSYYPRLPGTVLRVQYRVTTYSLYIQGQACKDGRSVYSLPHGVRRFRNDCQEQTAAAPIGCTGRVQVFMFLWCTCSPR